MPVLLVISYTCELDPTTSARVRRCSSLVHSLVPWAGNDVFRQKVDGGLMRQDLPNTIMRLGDFSADIPTGLPSHTCSPNKPHGRAGFSHDVNEC